MNQLRIPRRSYSSPVQSQLLSILSAFYYYFFFFFLHGSTLLLSVRGFLYTQDGWGELIPHFPSLGKSGLLLPAVCSAVADRMPPAHFLLYERAAPILLETSKGSHAVRV